MAERFPRTTAEYGSEIDSPESVPPGSTGRVDHAFLEDQARKIGRAAGRAVATLRKARATVSDIAEETGEVAAIRMSSLKNQTRRARAHASDIVEDAALAVAQKARRWREEAASAVIDLRRTAAETAHDVRSQVKTGYYRARLRTNRVVREHPLRVIMIFGLAGFVLGVGLRIWRSSREC